VLSYCFLSFISSFFPLCLIFCWHKGEKKQNVHLILQLNLASWTGQKRSARELVTKHVQLASLCFLGVRIEEWMRECCVYELFVSCGGGCMCFDQSLREREREQIKDRARSALCMHDKERGWQSRGELEIEGPKKKRCLSCFCESLLNPSTCCCAQL
jgi:hypothetical protein